ncbi:unnamed protein product [Heligmosomoides polygyrus]|uniref:Fibrillar collagen NC1 domain-containing protein n=1 Tax=Heligmosomoides polygyrus TaxID=6339 RepID=A0A183GCD7_HELPZ|nr:unnamed protein product [Heligmosomoides polygyrus]
MTLVREQLSRTGLSGHLQVTRLHLQRDGAAEQLHEEAPTWHCTELHSRSHDPIAISPTSSRTRAAVAGRFSAGRFDIRDLQRNRGSDQVVLFDPCAADDDETCWAPFNGPTTLSFFSREELNHLILTSAN